MIRTEDRPHCVYRFYDANGALLYVGMTANLSVRITQHKREKAWWPSVVRVALQHGSVRRVAAALGISPTTVQKWSNER